MLKLNPSIKTWLTWGLLLLSPVLIIMFSKVIFGLLINTAIILVFGLMIWLGWRMTLDLMDKGD